MVHVMLAYELAVVKILRSSVAKSNSIVFQHEPHTSSNMSKSNDGMIHVVHVDFHDLPLCVGSHFSATAHLGMSSVASNNTTASACLVDNVDELPVKIPQRVHRPRTLLLQIKMPVIAHRIRIQFAFVVERKESE